MRIVIIEDSEDDYHLLRLALNRQGYSTSKLKHALTLADGVRLIEETHPELIILDLDLGVGHSSGMELLELRKNASWSKIPIIVSSGHGDIETIDEALTLGADGYLIKEFIVKKFEQEIDRLGMFLRKKGM